MADRDRAAVALDQVRLRVRRHGVARRRVAHVADRAVPHQRLEPARREHVVHEAHALLEPNRRTVGGRRCPPTPGRGAAARRAPCRRGARRRGGRRCRTARTGRGSDRPRSAGAGAGRSAAARRSCDSPDVSIRTSGFAWLELLFRGGGCWPAPRSERSRSAVRARAAPWGLARSRRRSASSPRRAWPTRSPRSAARGRTASGCRAVFNFGASSDLSRQIRSGAPADVFFSADTAQMDALEREGLVRAADRQDLLSNTLVVIVPAASGATRGGPARPRRLQDDRARRPAGGAGRASTHAAGSKAWGSGPSSLPRVVPTLHVRAALAAVESENAEAGIVYRTDAAASKRARIAFEVPREQGPPIRYPVAPLVRSTHRGRERLRRLPALARRARGLHPPRLPRARRRVAC